MLDNCFPPDWHHNSPEQHWSHEGGDVDTSETFRLGRSLKNEEKAKLANCLKVNIEHNCSYTVLLDCLNEYKMEGNLMQALHMTETEGIGLEFRGQFTTRFFLSLLVCS